jgi:hypothetical protein
MAKAGSKSSKKHPYDDWPMAKPVPGTGGRLMEFDLTEFTREQRAEWDRQEAEGVRLRKLHERFGRKLGYVHKVRDGLLPPPWLSGDVTESPPPPPPPPPPKNRRAPVRDIICAIAKKKWPPDGKWSHLMSFKAAYKIIAAEMAKDGMPVPKDDTTFRRALGLRDD